MLCPVCELEIIDIHTATISFVLNEVTNHPFAKTSCSHDGVTFKLVHIPHGYSIGDVIGYVHPKFLRQFETVKYITRNNFIGVYCAWCLKNNAPILSHEILNEIFFGCETDLDYSETLKVLFIIINEGHKLSFMKDKQLKEAIIQRLKIRLELFKRIPSGTNMILAYSLIEELTLKEFSENSFTITEQIEKSIERFDKCKALALDTKIINERKLAFERSLELFKKLTKIEL